MNSMAPKILIIRMSALGDILHALPLLGAIKGALPQAQVGWLVEPGGAQLLRGHPLLDHLHLFPRQAWRENKKAAWNGPIRQMLGEIRSVGYDVALDVQGLTKSALWGWKAGIPRRIGFKGPEARELSGVLATERVRPPAGALHVVQKNLALLGPLGIAMPDPIRFPVHLPDTARLKASQILGEGAETAPLVLMNPGAGWATKIWAPERMGQLARRLLAARPCRIALAWGPGEQPLVEQVWKAAGMNGACDFSVAAVPGEPGLYVLPATTFIELGAVIERAGLFVGGDTGPTHFAAALEVPTVSMMGPLDARRNGPYGSRCRTIQHGVPRKASPWRNHRRWCDPLTDLAHVSVDEVFEACQQAWEKS